MSAPNLVKINLPKGFHFPPNAFRWADFLVPTSTLNFVGTSKFEAADSARFSLPQINSSTLMQGQTEP